ncbi:hypothetical protein, partial [Plasmodium yoelii yoelii]
MDVISNGTKLKNVDNEPEQYVNKNKNLGTNVSEKYVPELSSMYLKEDPLMLAENKSQNDESDQSEEKREEKLNILKNTDISDDEKLSKDDANEKYKNGDYEEALKIGKE